MRPVSPCNFYVLSTLWHITHDWYSKRKSNITAPANNKTHLQASETHAIASILEAFGHILFSQTTATIFMSGRGIHFLVSCSVSYFSLKQSLCCGANTAKIIVNVWDFGPLGTAITPLQWGGFPQRKCLLKNIICTGIIFVKYKEEIQVITTVNEFLRFHNQHYARYHENRSQKRRFIIRIYAGRRTFFK